MNRFVHAKCVQVVRSLKHAMQPAVIGAQVHFSLPLGCSAKVAPEQVPPIWNQLVRRQVEMSLMTDFVHVERLIDGFHSHFRVLRLNNWSLISRLFELYCSEFVGA